MVPLEKESVQIQTLQTFHGQRQGKHKLANLVYISIRVANLVRDPNKLLTQWRYKKMNKLSAKKFLGSNYFQLLLGIRSLKKQGFKIKVAGLPIYWLGVWVHSMSDLIFISKKVKNLWFSKICCFKNWLLIMSLAQKSLLWDKLSLKSIHPIHIGQKGSKLTNTMHYSNVNQPLRLRSSQK